MNTPDKRASALGRGLSFLTVLPLPDGTVSRADRKQVAGLYRGMLLPAGGTPAARMFVVESEVRMYQVEQEVRMYRVVQP